MTKKPMFYFSDTVFTTTLHVIFYLHSHRIFVVVNMSVIRHAAVARPYGTEFAGRLKT